MAYYEGDYPFGNNGGGMGFGGEWGGLIGLLIVASLFGNGGFGIGGGGRGQAADRYGCDRELHPRYQRRRRLIFI